MFPDMESVAIGNQVWATSNFEGIVAGDGTVIPEVKGTTTDGNAELTTMVIFQQAQRGGVSLVRRDPYSHICSGGQ
jgi:hypothetical protein